MKISRFTVNPFGVNSYVMWDADTLEAAIVDPGMTDEAERKALDSFIERQGLKPVHLINTHMHLDHIFGNLYVKEKYGLDIKVHPADDFLGRSLEDQTARFHLPIKATNQGLDVELHDGDRLYLGTEPIDIISVPGHSPGSVALYCPESGFVITGDALFRGSIGRTDLPMGDYPTLIAAIRDRLLTLPPDTVVLPGHGPESTIGQEKSSNPYIK
ncbi:MBL fold metallo-hydrolase [uncultured Duncaniella sp.]|uniref:MBL fold metallo-hydrolase n=1 Tax=uncultured Duncaniella sp. TaxID=2768039 RepID=UPI002674F382|nr:MBL fold metallo-hydrolase [uncultured Duncaniella sp.]